MTLHETLCAYQSPHWPNYQNLLDPKYAYTHDKVQLLLPKEATDSYLGRLLSIAIDANKYLERITASELDDYTEIVTIISASGPLMGRKFNSKLRTMLYSYLSYGLKADWLKPLLNEYKLSLWTNKKTSLYLNEPKYLDILCTLKNCSYAPVVAWFKRNPHGADKETKYMEKRDE